MKLRAAAHEKPFPEKNHDRFVMLKEIGRFAVFDGANHAAASEMGAGMFRELSLQADPLGLAEIFEAIHKALLEKFQGERLTTATAIALHERAGAWYMDKAHAGDSSLNLFNPLTSDLLLLTHPEPPPNPISMATDSRNFLGSPEQQLQQVETVSLLSPVT